MVQMHFEVEGDVDEVVRFLGHLGVRGSETVRGPDGRQIAATEQYREEDESRLRTGAGGKHTGAIVGRLDGGVGRRLHGGP